MTSRPGGRRTGRGSRRFTHRRAITVTVCLVAVLALGITRAATAGPATAGQADARAATNAVTVLADVTPIHWVSSVHSIRAGSSNREYLLIRPAGVSGEKLPVIVFLQGRAVSVQLEAQRDGLTSIVGPSILVYPAGSDEFWNAGACCGSAQADDVDDVSFLTAVIHDVASEQPDAQSGPVLMAGYSNGGKMAFLMACRHPELIRAVASIGAVSASPCTPGLVSLLELANSGDPELSIDGSRPPTSYGSYTDPTVDAQVGQQRTTDGCPATSRQQTEGVMTVTTWAPCHNGSQVSLALFDYPDHRLEPGQGPTPSAGQEIWAFFVSLGI